MMKSLRKAREVVGKKKAREGMQKDFESRWHDVAEEVMSGMREWRIELTQNLELHPKGHYFTFFP
jgi:hypothetical protein